MKKVSPLPMHAWLLTLLATTALFACEDQATQTHHAVANPTKANDEVAHAAQPEKDNEISVRAKPEDHTTAFRSPSAPLPGSFGPLDIQAPDGKSLLVLHYHRPDSRYQGWNAWAWAAGQDGQSHAFTGRDAFGTYAVIEMPEAFEAGNFIIRKGDWQAKDIDHDRSVPFDNRRIAEAWLVSGDPTIYTSPEQIDFSVRVRAAFLDSPRRINLTLTQPVAVDDLATSEVRITAGDKTIPARRIEPVKPENAEHARGFRIDLSRPITPRELTAPISITLGATEPFIVTARDILSAREFSPLDAKLGPDYSTHSTTFVTWSPVAASAELLLYGKDNKEEPEQVLPLETKRRGLWTVTVPGDLNGVYYQYRFNSYGKDRVVPDIHAFAATADSTRSMVINLGATNPDGWNTHRPPRLRNPTDEVIYEVHVRDMSIADPSVPQEHRGKYLGMIQGSDGTGEMTVTGIHHLKKTRYYGRPPAPDPRLRLLRARRLQLGILDLPVQRPRIQLQHQPG